MNIEAFLWSAAALKLLEAAPGEIRVGGKDRAAIEFGLRKEIVRGSWNGGMLVFEGFGPQGEEFVRLLLSDPAQRRAIEEEFPTATRFHLKAAFRLLRARQAGTSTGESPSSK